MHFIYSPRYHADIGIHVFPIEKYRLVAQALQRQHQIPENAFVAPQAATEEQLLQVHTRHYLDDLYHCRWTPRTLCSELPLTREIVDMFTLACGGTILAAELALRDGAAVHLGGGFHHAFAEKAEGFCYLNDLAVAVRAMQTPPSLNKTFNGRAGLRQNKIEKAMVIDCDLHQGNGTAKIFQPETNVFTFSIHQKELYPVKEESDLDIHLQNGVTDAEYLRHLQTHIPKILDAFRPELILYQAGADPYEHDQLGDLKLTLQGLAERDRLIVFWAKERKIPIAVTLGGGYALNTDDTVAIHVNTGLAAWQQWNID
jgi:acetoin utilization deacetylase AcuC-like enzyme